jgi:hypothetical protein
VNKATLNRLLEELRIARAGGERILDDPLSREADCKYALLRIQAAQRDVNAASAAILVQSVKRKQAERTKKAKTEVEAQAKAEEARPRPPQKPFTFDALLAACRARRDHDWERLRLEEMEREKDEIRAEREKPERQRHDASGWNMASVMWRFVPHKRTSSQADRLVVRWGWDKAGGGWRKAGHGD